MANAVKANRLLSASYDMPDGSKMTGFELVTLKRTSLQWMIDTLQEFSIEEIFNIPMGKRIFYDKDWNRVTIKRMGKISGHSETLIRNRLDAGWSVEEAIGPGDELPERFAHVPRTNRAVRVSDLRCGKRRSASAAASPQPFPDLEPPVNPGLLHLTWDERFMELARFWSQNSKDPSTKVGAVIVGSDKREVCMGYNGFPPGIADDDRLKERATKYPIMIHAERNALDNARFDTRGATLYATLAPCCGCAASIVSKGIKRVVCPAINPDSDIAKRHGITEAVNTLKEGGVVIEWVGWPE